MAENKNMVMPQALEIERCVLGALMINKDAFDIVSDRLRPESFYDPRHQIIFGVIQNMVLQNKPVDMLTVSEELSNTNKLDKVGGAIYIADLCNKVASSANVEYHSRIIQQKSLARDLITTATKAISDAYNESDAIDDILQKTEENIYQLGIMLTSRGRSYEQMDKYLLETDKQLQLAADGNGIGIFAERIFFKKRIVLNRQNMVAAVGNKFHPLIFNFLFIFRIYIIGNSFIVADYNIRIMDSHLFAEFQKPLCIPLPFVAPPFKTVYVCYDFSFKAPADKRQKHTPGNTQNQHNVRIQRTLHSFKIVKNTFNSVCILFKIDKFCPLVRKKTFFIFFCRTKHSIFYILRCKIQQIVHKRFKPTVTGRNADCADDRDAESFSHRFKRFAKICVELNVSQPIIIFKHKCLQKPFLAFSDIFIFGKKTGNYFPM